MLAKCYFDVQEPLQSSGTASEPGPFEHAGSVVCGDVIVLLLPALQRQECPQSSSDGWALTDCVVPCLGYTF
jgi:hypothetical protein